MTGQKDLAGRKARALIKCFFSLRFRRRLQRSCNLPPICEISARQHTPRDQNLHQHMNFTLAHMHISGDLRPGGSLASPPVIVTNVIGNPFEIS